MSGNLGYSFYKDIYILNPENIVSDADRIQSLLESRITTPSEIIGKQHFLLYTTYPGIVIGTGLSHGVKDDNNDFKIGFTFDHTTGLPVIPGSSVKGLLRSVFPNLEKDKHVRSTKTKWLLSLLEGMQDPDDVYFNKTYHPIVKEPDEKGRSLISNIEKEIFDGIRNDENVNIYKRDIFHDAVISSINKKFLGTDYITPHFPNVLKNPIPIKFLKVLPEIEFTFQFDLKNGILTFDQKVKLFRKILLSIGIGAKTNVGYGQFDPIMPGVRPKSSGKAIAEQKSANIITKPILKVPILPSPKPLNKVNNGDRVAGTVMDNSNGELFFKVDVDGEYIVKPVKFGSSLDCNIGSKAILEVANKQKEKGIWTLILKNPRFIQ